jgi:hypothetical protein
MAISTGHLLRERRHMLHPVVDRGGIHGATPWGEQFRPIRIGEAISEIPMDG